MNIKVRCTCERVVTVPVNGGLTSILPAGGMTRSAVAMKDCECGKRVEVAVEINTWAVVPVEKRGL